MVSIITPTYNSALYVSETLDSIIAQTHTDWELILTDDCSTDETWDIVQGYAERDPRIRIFRLQENSGTAVARNNSIKHANGRYIAFCDSDDLWVAEKLERQIAFMQEYDLALTYSAYRKIMEDGTARGIVYPPKILKYPDLLKSNYIGCLTAIYDVDKLGKVYMPNFRKRQDYGLWLEIFKRIGSTKGMHKDVLALYRVRNESLSGNKLKASYYHFIILREVVGLSSLKAAYYFALYSFHGVLKYLK